MSSDTAGGGKSAATPFEWLSGGLFFGKKSEGGIASIDSCKDVSALLTGIDENLKEIWSSRKDAPLEPEESKKAAAEEEPPQPTTAESTPTSEPEMTQAETYLAARSQRLRFLLYEERRISSQQEGRKSTPTVAGATVQSLTSESLNHLIPRLLDNLASLPFESRKHVASIFNYLLVCGLEGVDAGLYEPIMASFRDYVESRFDEIMPSLLNGHDCTKTDAPADVGLHCGSMYRSCARHVNLYRQLTMTTERCQQYVFPFLDKFVHFPNFDIASDSMETVRLIFTGGGDSHPDEESHQAMAELAAEFLTRDYDAIWVERFNPLLLSDKANYMTRRMALQILSTVLLTRSNYAVMIQYVASRSNLILVMKLLRDTSPHITLDSFHVFKVFVANPNKPPEIVKILQDNSAKLCRYLETLHADREQADPQFRDEKALIIATIDAL